MIKETAIASMGEYFQGDERRIQHALKVMNYGEQIYNGEKLEDAFVYQVIILSGIFHDIGIPEAERKYNSSAARYQEMEGPPIARELLESLKVRPDILERVCYIVGNHHTLEKVDSMDFQVLWEADLLVNMEEGSIPIQKGQSVEPMKRHFKTATGSKIFMEITGKLL